LTQIEKVTFTTLLGRTVNKNTLTRQQRSAGWIKEGLKKFTQITDPKQVEEIRLYIGISKLTESFKTVFVPTGVATPKKSGLVKLTHAVSGQKRIK
jgi:hypothetical protein